MKQDNNLHPGEKIEILIGGQEDPSRLLSKVESVIDSNNLIISRPISDEKYTYLSLGEVIRVVYFREDGAYYFDARVTERIKSQETISARLAATSEKYKLQRRNYFRLNTMVPVVLDYMERGARVSRKFDTLDISGGGLKMSSKTIINRGTEVSVYIKIRGIEAHEVKGKVVRVTPSEKDKGMFEMGVEFTSMDQKVRQAIIQYVFIRQREILKRGFK